MVSLAAFDCGCIKLTRASATIRRYGALWERQPSLNYDALIAWLYCAWKTQIEW
jgi:hypothetical protein